VPTSNNTKQILIGNFKTQSHVLCTAFFCSQVSKTTWNALNCYVNLTNRFRVAVRLFTIGSQQTTKWGKNKKVTIRAMRPWRHNLCELRLVHCNFRYVIGMWGILPYTQESYLTNMPLDQSRFFRLHSTFARLYNAAASPASRLRSAGSLAIINISFPDKTNC